MFQTGKGMKVPFPEKIMQTYKIHDNCLQLTLSFEKIMPMLQEFVARIEEPMFIALHIPLCRDEEEKHRTKPTDPFHERICYLDGLSRSEVYTILKKYGVIILHNDMAPFAVASHVTHEEFFLEKYQIVTIFSKQPTDWVDLMVKYDIQRTDQLYTAWQTFTKDHPGESCVVKIHGHDIFYVYNKLKKLGIYEAKVVESD